jgi:hypothetical protein
MINETKKVLSEPNVKVVFHHPAAPVTPLSTWIIYPKGSALGHSTRCREEENESETRPKGRGVASVDSLFCSRCRTCCSVGGRSSYMDPFLSVVASAGPSRNSLSSKRAGKAQRKAAVPIGHPRPDSFSPSSSRGDGMNFSAGEKT